MPLCPQITNTPITVVLNSDFTVTSVIPVLPATTEQLNDIVVVLDGKTKAYYQTTAPVTGLNEGDIWFDTDDGNKQYFYTGTAWVSVQDTAIAAAQSTADGKNKVFRQTSAPTASAAGDLWFDTDDDNRIYRWSGTAWVANDLGTNALANFSANKITSGSIDASVVTVSNINAGNISTGSLASARIAAGTIVASQIATGTITATQIAAGTITTTQLATGTLSATNITTGTLSASVALSAVSGTIGGFTIGATNISAGTSLDIQSTGSIIGGNSQTIFYGFANIGGGTAGSERLIVTGNSNLNGTLIVSGTTTIQGDANLSASSDLRVPLAFSTTTANAATVWVSSTGQFRRSTASSERYKTDIVNLIDVAELDPKALYDLPVRAFRFKEGYLPATDDRFGVLVPGFIAEEMDAIYPAATDYTDGVETWNDRMIIPAMLALIQDQQARIKALEGA
jgi:hypothetical protein